MRSRKKDGQPGERNSGLAHSAVRRSDSQSGSFIRADGLGPRVRCLSTTRSGGSSRPPYDTLNLGGHVGDDPQAVDANRKQLDRILPESPVWLDQVHGTNVLLADHWQTDSTPARADAAVTARRGQVLAILTADCMPVVLADPLRRVLGVAHAGWRGLASGVLINTVQAMRERFHEPLDIRAWIGPCIGPAAFQVGHEVRETFLAMDTSLAVFFRKDDPYPDKWLADLPGIARWQLMSLGAAHVEWCGLCTVNDPERRFFSYRRDGQTGRMATLAWLDTSPDP